MSPERYRKSKTGGEEIVWICYAVGFFTEDVMPPESITMIYVYESNAADVLLVSYPYLTDAG